MVSVRTCPDCGARIPSGSKEGLCGRCMLKMALQTQQKEAAGSAFAATQQSSGPFIPPAPAELDTLFPELEVLELLGQGGMGAVYKARQTKLDRLVALKLVRPDAAASDSFAERFNREARALAKLSHPNIVAVFDFGDLDFPGNSTLPPSHLYYFLMEYVDGLDLRRLMEAEDTGTREALAIVGQICEALQYAHNHGVVHRDIKPENILLDTDGRVKIADFGLAKLGDETEQLRLTGTRQVLGTLRYMAPEQMSQSRTVDHRADIYSLGVVFYEMLTGDVPAGVFEPPSDRAGVDPRLDEVVMKALASDPKKRFQSASAVSRKISDVSSAQNKVSPEQPPYVRGASTMIEDGAAFVAGHVRNLFQPKPPPRVAAGATDVTLARTDVERNQNLPDICVVCGCDTSGRITREFRYTDDSVQWIIVLLMILFFPLGIIVAVYFEQKCRATLPVCPDHRTHWTKYQLWASVGWSVILICPGLVFLLNSLYGDMEPNIFQLIIANVFGALVYIVPLISLAWTCVGVVSITDADITLQRTATEFSRAASELRVND